MNVEVILPNSSLYRRSERERDSGHDGDDGDENEDE